MQTQIDEFRGILEKNKSAITIGNFDGQHIGHRRMFELVKESAAGNHIKSVVLSFFPHPAYVLRNDPEYKLITSYAERRVNIRASGVDYFIEYPFSTEFARTEPVDFLRLLADEFNCRQLFIGEDYRFGKDRQGCMRDFKEFANQLGINVNVIPAVYMDGEMVSSTVIRNCIRETQFDKAEMLLGRPFSVRGVVVKGKSRGAGLGFPTANITPSPEKLLPPDGVYLTTVHLRGSAYKSVTNFGSNPTFNGSHRTVENHIFNFNTDITGEEISVDIIRFIRGERKFGNAAELVQQIGLDIESVK